MTVGNTLKSTCKKRTGRVVSDAMDKTIVVLLETRRRHPKYGKMVKYVKKLYAHCLLYTSPSPRDGLLSRMPSSA